VAKATNGIRKLFTLDASRAIERSLSYNLEGIKPQYCLMGEPGAQPHLPSLIVDEKYLK
jgi:hypothetical protein